MKDNLKPSNHLLPWLTHTQSLTKKLYEKSGQTTLKVLNQQWEMANEWDRTVLNLSIEPVIHREIVTTAYEEPCWYARTILPKLTYESNINLFDRLKLEPLGNLIFNHDTVQRLSLSYYPIDKQMIEFHWLEKYRLIATYHPLWLRSSVFKLPNDTKFYLIEILLPALEKYL